MTDLVQLVWKEKSDAHAECMVFSTWTESGMASLRSLAMALHKTDICCSIKITDSHGSLVEDWSKGVARDSTTIFNDKMRQILDRD